MQAQDLSYKLNNSIIQVRDQKNKTDIFASVEVFTLENVYTVPKFYIQDNGCYFAEQLLWGNREKAEGRVSLSVNDSKDGKLLKAQAVMDQDIRGVKIRLDNLPLGKLISLISGEQIITEYGVNYTYPEGWRGLITPLLVFELPDKEYLFIRTLDKTVNVKRFFIKKVGGRMRVDIVQEQDGVYISGRYDVPAVQYGITSDLESLYCEQSELIKNTYGLSDFENSAIVPKWLNDISLVVTMHMQSFTGYIFHTYDQVCCDIEKLTQFIDGRKILVYLPGWEGRYYYKYGDYTPDARMGGAEDLKKCVDKLHSLGCKVMAMYGMTIANKNHPPIRALAEDSELESVSGARFHSGSVDWEGAHHYDFGGFVNLNIASPKWGEYLFEEIKRNTLQFGFDGAFLDIAASYLNDGRYRIYDGLVEFCDRLRTIKKDFLVSGEGFYDGMARAMPLFQSGHTDGAMHYHDSVSPKLFTRFARNFAHLCLGDPSRGSTGVHELGTNCERTVPRRRGIIPTLSLVDNSFNATEEIKKIIQQAKCYKEGYFA